MKKTQRFKVLLLACSRLQKVGIWVWGDLCWFSSLSGFGVGGQSYSNFLVSTVLGFPGIGFRPNLGSVPMFCGPPQGPLKAQIFASSGRAFWLWGRHRGSFFWVAVQGGSYFEVVKYEIDSNTKDHGINNTVSGLW